MDNRLSIHFGEDKTIHSASRQKRKKFPELKQNLQKYKNQTIFKTKYTGCIFDKAMRVNESQWRAMKHESHERVMRESMALKVIHKKETPC